MVKIIINAVTFKAACTDGRGEEDVRVYDAAVGRFFFNLRSAATDKGFDFEVDNSGQGTASYRVMNERGYRELASAYDFMQSPAADFWSSL